MSIISAKSDTSVGEPDDIGFHLEIQIVICFQVMHLVGHWHHKKFTEIVISPE